MQSIECAELTDQVKNDITEFLKVYWPDFKSNAKEYDGLEITFATNDQGDTWNYQTGDNSYTGGCYSLPHWGVETITLDSTPQEIAESIIDQLTELLPSNR